MPWFIDQEQSASVSLRPRARAVADMLGFGQMPRISPGVIDAVMELIENDVLLHTDLDSQTARLRALGQMIEASDPRPRH